MSEFKIEKDVPLPPCPYPFYEMEVGDSFFVPMQMYAKMGPNVMGEAMKAGYDIRKLRGEYVEGGYRVWRVA